MKDRESFEALREAVSEWCAAVARVAGEKKADPEEEIAAFRELLKAAKERDQALGRPSLFGGGAA